MSEKNRSLLIGVDAGGSKTVAWVADDLGVESSNFEQPIGRGSSGPGNPRAVGFKTATNAIAEATGNALQDAGMLPNAQADNRSIKWCISAAGAGRDDEQQQLTEWAWRSIPAATVRVTDDAQPILAAASADGVGIALICGTGSFAWGRNTSGKVTRCGGWGYLFGDEGSGYALGIAALRAAVQFVDGRGEQTILLEGISKHFEISDSSQLIDKVYSTPMPRGGIAQLSELVFAAAETDRVARSIVEDSARSLAELVIATADRLGFDSAKRDEQPVLALAGGVLVHQQMIREALMRRVDQLFPTMQIVSDPVAGAIRLAAML